MFNPAFDTSANEVSSQRLHVRMSVCLSVSLSAY